MNKKLWSVLAAAALVASLFNGVPARATPEIPSDEHANIVDPAGDSNGLNDQGLGLGFGDNSGGVYFGGADLLKIWFTNTADSISAHILTTTPGTGGDHAYAYRVHVNDDCIWFQGTVDGTANPADPRALLRDLCNEAEAVEGEIVMEEVNDGQGLTTLTFPMRALPDLAPGKSLSEPFATSRYFGPTNHTAPQLDDTQIGKDYVITSGGVASGTPVMQPAPKVKKAKKKNCKKIKNKKKRKKCLKRNKRLAKRKGCAAYVPGEMGAEVEEPTTVVTDAATEEAPIEIEVPIGEGATYFGGPTPDLTSRVFHNVQVNSKNAEAGFFAKLESPETDDPDLYVYWDNGTQAAVAGGFNQALIAGPLPENPVINLNGTGSGGHSGFGYEQIDGLRTAKCAGWTLDLVNWLGLGGTYTLKLWLGEIENDPAPRE